MKLINKLIICATSVVSLGWSTSCGRISKFTNIQILCTSDIHGMLIPFDYALNQEVPNRGSLSQIGSIIKLLRNENTLTIDVGDIIQGNYADLFIKNETHPMIEGLNLLNYDVFVTGNHEYNFKMDYLKKQISKFNGTTLTGNVFKEGTHEPLAPAYKIFNKDGVRVAVIGMTTHLIKTWDAENLKGWDVTNPAEETKKTVNYIKYNDLADVIIAAEHLGMPREYEEKGTSCRELAKECPDIDVILGAHEHKDYIETVDDVLIVENKSNAQTLMKIDLQIRRDHNYCHVVNKKATKIEVGKFPKLKVIEDFAKPYDEEAKKDARRVIGKLTNGPMSPEYEIKKVPSTFMKPTPLTSFINEVQLAAARSEFKDPSEAAKVKVASTAVGNYRANLGNGEVHKYDCSNIYKYENTLYILEMTGKQLKQYLEWTSKFYQIHEKGKDLTIAFKENSDFALFNYDMFTGIDYTIDISKEEGKRIIGLKWTGGSEIEEGETFYAAFNNYRCNSHLLKPGLIYDTKENCPKLKISDVNKGKGIREMIVSYVEETLEGNLDASKFNYSNWEIAGPLWLDATKKEEIKMHEDAVDNINNNVPGYDIGEFNTIKIKKPTI